MPTAPAVVAPARLRRARALRRVSLAVLGGYVGLAALGFLGVRSQTVVASGGGYRLSVTYGQVGRPGLAVPWTVVVRREGGYDGPVEVATTAAYFRLFDENGLDPDPIEARSHGGLLVWRFAAPDGEVLTIDLDARISPAVQWGTTAVTSVLVDGRPVVTVRYRTWVVP